VRCVEVDPVELASFEPIAADCIALAAAVATDTPPESGWASCATEKAATAGEPQTSQ